MILNTVLLAFLFSSIVLPSSSAILPLSSPNDNANNSSSAMVIHDSRDNPPTGFVKVGPASNETVLQIRMAMVSSDAVGLQRKTVDVSTPGGGEYGEHLSKEQTEAFIRPSKETLDIVNTWLTSNNIASKSISPAGDWISFSIPVSQASTLFGGAQFNLYEDTHSNTKKQYVRCLSYSLPANVAPHVDAMYPLTSFPTNNVISPRMTFNPPRPKARAEDNSTEVATAAGGVDASCSKVVTPQCLQALYGIPKDAAKQDKNVLGVPGYVEQYVNGDDLKSFLTTYRTDMSPDTTFTLQTIDGGQNLQDIANAGIEANLDIQYTVGLATGVPTTFISVGSQNTDGDLYGFLDIINVLLAEENPPSVLTTSYGFAEENISPRLANNLCNAFAQLGARGTSLLFASGDTGASTTDNCILYTPTFPSGCPYVTSVGSSTGIPESAAYFSSGGFSTYFARPEYQSAALTKYLASDAYALDVTNVGRTAPNILNRAFPDVAAQGTNLAIFLSSQQVLVGGTSASSPIFASIISLLNDALLAAGKPTLGFLNPLLYSEDGMEKALNDIVGGNAPGCGGSGFRAVEGWDPVTGLGTPDFKGFLEVLGLGGD